MFLLGEGIFWDTTASLIQRNSLSLETIPIVPSQGNIISWLKVQLCSIEWSQWVSMPVWPFIQYTHAHARTHTHTHTSIFYHFSFAPDQYCTSHESRGNVFENNVLRWSAELYCGLGNFRLTSCFVDHQQSTINYSVQKIYEERLYS